MAILLENLRTKKTNVAKTLFFYPRETHLGYKFIYLPIVGDSHKERKWCDASVLDPKGKIISIFENLKI